MEQLWQWLDFGGLMLIPIAVASVVGVALFVARWRAHRSERVIPLDTKIRVLQAVRDEEWERADEICRKSSSPVSRVYTEGLRFRGAKRREIREAMEEVGRREMNRLERYVGAVGAMASVTPLMGLLGTVLGMIRVFQVVVDDASSAGGVVDPTALAGGIWEALVTTAAGLAVAIPLYLGYRYLLGRLDTLSVDLEEAAGSLLDRLAPPPQGIAAEAVVGTEGARREEKEESPDSAEVLAAEGA